MTRNYAAFLILLYTASAFGSPCIRRLARTQSNHSARCGEDHLHLESIGEQAGLWGSLGDGVEAWVYPFKLFDQLEILYKPKGAAAFVHHRRLARQQVSETAIVRIETVEDRFRCTENFFAPRQLPGLLILLDVDALDQIEVAIRFRPSLAPMLMQESDVLETAWNQSEHSVTFRDSRFDAEFELHSPQAVDHRQLEDGRHEVLLRVSPETAKRGPIRIVMSGSWPDSTRCAATRTTLLESFEQQIQIAQDHYQTLLDKAPEVQSPDARVNAAMSWSTVSLDQLRVNNPFLGYGLVSGYSSSGQTARPRYSWFFDEPTLASRAYLSAGLDGHVRQALSMLQDYQRDDGKTVHEISQSLPFQPQFLETYPYAYVHTDGPVYFLNAYGHYLRTTGDLDFIRLHWPKIQKTFAWCLSRVDPNDGLMIVKDDDWGSVEVDTRVWKDTQLEAMWLRSCEKSVFWQKPCKIFNFSNNATLWRS